MASEATIEGGLPSQKPEGKRKMSTETTGGQPSPGLFERVKNLRNLWRKEQDQADEGPESPSRRRFLKAAAASTAVLGGAALIESQTGLISKGLRDVGMLSGKPKEQLAEVNVFDQMREVIGAAYEGAQREDLLRIAGDLEKVNLKLFEFRQHEGVKKLVEDTRLSFGNLDVSPLLGTGYQNEREFWEEQIPFLRDARKLREISEKVLNLPNRQDKQFALAETIAQLKIADPTREGADFSVYLKRDNLPRSGVKIIPVSKVPGVPFIEGSYGFPTMDRAVEIAEAVSRKIPNVGEVLLYLVPVNADFIGFGGRFFEKGKVQFNMSDRFSEFKDLTVAEGQSVCVVAAGSLDLERSVAHEKSHSAGPRDNYANFARYLESKPVVSSMILDTALNLGPDWTLLTPDSKLVFSKEMAKGSIERPQSTGEPLTARDFMLQKIAKAHLHWFDKNRLIFDKGLLDTSSLDQFAQTTPSTKWYYGVEPYMGQEGDPPMVNFVNMEKERLDKWAGQDPVRKFVVGRLREEAQNLRFFIWTDFAADIPQVFNPETFWKSMPTFANLFLVEAFFANNRSVVEMFPVEQRRSIITRMIARQNQVLSEMSAEHKALTVTAKKGQAARDPGEVFLSDLAKAAA